MRYILLSCVFLCLSSQILSQTVVSGRISDAETKAALDRAIVKVLNDQRQLIAYTITDKEGDYSVKVKSSLPELLLSVHYLGYRTEVIKIPNKTTRKNFALHSEAVNLKEVHVKPRPIAKRGDTLSYNVSSFKMEQDRSIADILRKMPGITVNASGGVKYMGRPINKFYIEGLDLLGRKYGLATTSVPADAVSTVQVLENHQPIKALGKHTSTQAALNLVLKDKKRVRPVGYAEGGLGGMKDKALWKADVFALSLGTGSQSLVSYKGNNVGRQLAELASGQTVGMEDLEEGFSIQPSNLFSGVMLQTLPVEPERYVSNTSHLGTYNQLWKTGELQWRVSGFYLNERNKQKIRTEKDYFLPDEERYRLVEDNASGIRDNKLSVTLEAESNREKLYVKNALDVYADWQYHGYQLLTNDVIRQQKLEMPTYGVQNALKFIKRMGRYTFNAYSQVRYLNQPQWLEVKNEDVENVGLLRQDITRGTLYTKHGGKLSFSKGVSTFGLGLSVKAIVDDYESENNHALLQELGYSSRNDVKNYNYEFSVAPNYHFRSKGGKIRMQFGLPFSWHRYDVKNTYGTDLDVHLWNWEPTTSFHYDLNDDWKASLSYAYSRQLGDLLDFIDAPVMQNYHYWNMKSGILEKRKSDSYTFRLSYRNQIDALFFNFSAIYRAMEINTIRGNTFGEGYIMTHTKELPNNRDVTTLTASLQKFVDAWRTNVSVYGAYTHSISSQYQQEKLYPWNSDVYQCRLALDSKLATWLNLESSVQYWTGFYDNQEDAKRRNQLVSGRMGVFVFPSPKMFVSLSGEYSWQKSGEQDENRCFFVDAKANYKMKGWELEMVWQNMLNKGLYENVSYGNLNVTNVSFPLRTSNVLFSVRYNF